MLERGTVWQDTKMKTFIFVAIATTLVAGPSFAQDDSSRLRAMQEKVDRLRDAANRERQDEWMNFITSDDPYVMPPRPLSSDELEAGVHD